MNEVDELIGLLEKFRGYKLSASVRVLHQVGNTMLPMNLQGHIELCVNSTSNKELKLEFEAKENIFRGK